MRHAELERFASACHTLCEDTEVLQDVLQAPGASFINRPARNAQEASKLCSMATDSTGRSANGSRLTCAADASTGAEPAVTNQPHPGPGSRRPLGRDRGLTACATVKMAWDALASGSVAVVSFAGGVGSRWTQGAGVVKALNPFFKLGSH